MGAFEAFWKERFGAIPPYGSALRENLPHRWFRIHSLPGSKRYAETPPEYEILLGRHGAVADTVIGQADCWLSLFVWYFPDESTSIANEKETARRLGLVESFKGVDDGACRRGEGERSTFIVFAGESRWDTVAFEPWLRAVADDDVDALIWTSKDTGAIYAPYDGGADLFAPDTESRLELARQFQFWRSARPDGL